MCGFWLDYFLVEILPSVALGIGLFVYTFTQDLRIWFKGIIPFLIFGLGASINHSGIFWNENPFYHFLILILAFSLLLIMQYRNIGFSLIAFGGMSNALVSLVNGGRMPVFGMEVISEFHQPMTHNTVFSFLCDWILSPCGYYYLSFGDILLTIGAIIFMAQNLLDAWRNFKKEKVS